MSPLPLLALAVGAFAGGIALNADADNRLATQEDAQSKGGPAPSTATFRVESGAGTLLAIAGIVGVIMATVKATER